jgi:hypothetical protein
MSTFVLVLVFSMSLNSVGTTTVDGFKDQASCLAAGNAAKDQIGFPITLRFACIKRQP